MPTVSQPPCHVSVTDSPVSPGSSPPDNAYPVGAPANLEDAARQLLGLAGEASTAPEAPRLARRLVSALAPLLAGDDTTEAPAPEGVLSVEDAYIADAEEIARVEDMAGDAPSEEMSLAGILAFALTPTGGTLLEGLLDLIERQLDAAAHMDRTGLAPRYVETAHRFTHAAMEIERRTRVGRDLAAAKGGAK